MATKTTRWTLDHCGCVVEYTWDDQVAPEARVHTYARSVMICSAHVAHANKPTHYDVVLAENARKNAVVNLVNPADPVNVKYSFDETRKLTVEAPALAKAAKDTLQFQMNLMHGSGKVAII